ncbi:CAP domain-containing protein [Notoacmeibacter ruber]|uniref:CAP domain-containing protein n=1 Tax=Notoacmeibacter ruber TaxID=2670375 RepID=A0A3L7JBH9_9HYPH|nr:CAP domain-containing protein [Notoacmeibacter ruber]RLQ87840.1 CAP domain-containing protein [Notoacmeibacter ruber]
MRPVMRGLRLHAAAWTCVLLAALLPLSAAIAQDNQQVLGSLRSHSVELVNASRARHDLPPLTLSAPLNEAALIHARDMLKNDYFSHVTPDGETALDRYLSAGGDDSRIVRENIARCSGCSAPGIEAVEELHEGWMNSPGHRENILARGLTNYGFAVVYDDGRRFAVETFAGPGTSLSGGDHGGEPIDAARQTQFAVAMINETRSGTTPLSSSSGLRRHIEKTLPDADFDSDVLQSLDLLKGLPRREEWQSLQAISARCSGCGSTVTQSDVAYFVEEWTRNSRYKPILGDAGYAEMALVISADGKGSKIAVAIFAGPL